ncbi:MAG: TonB-dependent receptor plug domain-containing protein [Bacteroidales bacterium]|nr:TonB-dependent receptor plug domain-containing protein [Bacteroidales bacterium]
MKKFGLIVITIWNIITNHIHGQIYTVSGLIKSHATGEPLANAYCINLKNRQTIFSNDEGFFSLQCEGLTQLQFSYIGSQPTVLTFNQTRDTSITVFLTPDTIKAVYVQAREKLYMQTLMGKTTLNASLINQLPSFVGIPDAIKSIATLPGITTGKEGFSYIHVRGGTIGQNLILLDGTPLFHYNHVAGLTSAINTYAIDNIELYKSGFPARYGNCSSSIIDFRIREGNKNRYQGKIEIGTLTTHATVEGPLNKKRSGSFLLATRATYFDILNIPKYLRYLDTLEYQNDLKSYDGVSFVSLNAYDINLKLTQNLANRHKINIHSFVAQDFLKTTNEWTNSNDNVGYRNNSILMTGSIKSQVSSKIYTTLHLAYSSNYTKCFNDYDYRGETREKNESWTKNLMQYYQIRLFVDYYFNNKLTFKSGTEFYTTQIQPFINYQQNILNDVITKDTTMGYYFKYNAHNIAVFFENDYRINSKLSTNLGIRGTFFKSTDKLTGIEPRISIRWLVAKEHSIKLNYTFTKQFMHQILLLSSGRYFTFWLPANKTHPTEEVHQVAAGYFGIINEFEYGVELFYKSMNKLVELKIIEEQNITSAYDRLSLPGLGNAYGMETYFEKNIGKITGSINYTLMWSWRKFDDINFGRRYPFTYNHRHVVNTKIFFPINNEWSLSSSWIFMSGQPFTIPVAYSSGNSYFTENPLFSGVNNTNLPPYHRLDIQIMRNWTSKKGYSKYAKINVYNAYLRHNPAYARVSEGKLTIISLYQIIPTISYGWNF